MISLNIIADIEHLFNDIFGVKPAAAAPVANPNEGTPAPSSDSCIGTPAPDPNAAIAAAKAAVDDIKAKVDAAHDQFTQIASNVVQQSAPEAKSALPVLVEAFKQVAIASATAAITSKLQQ